jgi:hypothetical protein
MMPQLKSPELAEKSPQLTKVPLVLFVEVRRPNLNVQLMILAGSYTISIFKILQPKYKY